MRAARIAIAALALICAGRARADEVEDFYRGKTIQFIIRSAAGGGGYDSYARLLGRHIGRHIPGNPNVIPVNMPGGGGIVSANYVAKVAPKDGTILAIIGQGLVVDQALGLNKSLQADLRAFNWIGNMSDSNQILAVWHTSPTQSFEQARARETTIGTTQAGSISQQLTSFYINVLGAKLKIIFGYQDGRDVDLAMERGELEGRGTNTWASYLAITPQYVTQKLITPILQVGLRKDPALPDTPLLRDLARAPADQPLLDFMSEAVAVGRPIATTPGVPASRLAALRHAFDETLKDPQFIAEARTERAEISPMTGAELARLVDDLIGAPDAIKSRVREAIAPNAAQMHEAPGAKPAGGKE